MTRDRTARREALEAVDLYLVTSASASRGRPSLDILDAALDAGVRMVQLREKELGKGDLYQLAREFRSRTTAAGCLLIINDHVDVALACGADGVHLGQSDLPVEAARSIAPGLILGASSHDEDEARQAARAGADYVNIGPIFPTSTKPDASRFLGPEAISTIAPSLSIPFTCMGGISRDNVNRVLARGARIVAVVSAVTAAEDPAAAARELRDLVLAGRS
ncbi:MAG: thiamine phosphate synthase [Deltaproteobacteria bacterium]|jgi:thiamine-phosphate pyrophosphorylase|nr:thiamine phosphate synthase [Deltaproteobacteria bacterium]